MPHSHQRELRKKLPGHPIIPPASRDHVAGSQAGIPDPRENARESGRAGTIREVRQPRRAGEEALGHAWEVGERGSDEVVVSSAEEFLAEAVGVEMDVHSCEDLGEAVESAGVGRGWRRLV